MSSWSAAYGGSHYPTLGQDKRLVLPIACSPVASPYTAARFNYHTFLYVYCNTGLERITMQVYRVDMCLSLLDVHQILHLCCLEYTFPLSTAAVRVLAEAFERVHWLCDSAVGTAQPEGQGRFGMPCAVIRWSGRQRAPKLDWL